MTLERNQQHAEPSEPLPEAVKRVMSEADDWQRIMRLDGDAAITVYLDMKSPHAYIAVRPTLELARDYRVSIDFRPYTLSYTGMGISTSVENNKRRPPTAGSDRRARMFYAAARQYASLQRIPLRSPIRLLDASLAHCAFLFAKRQGLEIPFMMDVCLRGWGSGWREVEIESLDELRDSLIRVGADMTGFEAFVAPDGPASIELSACIEQAHASGLVGVPHYVFYDHDTDREVGLFGREHLALIRTKLSALGLARHDRVQADFSHAWTGPNA